MGHIVSNNSMPHLVLDNMFVFYPVTFVMLVLVNWEFRVERIKSGRVVFITFKLVCIVEWKVLYPHALPTMCPVMSTIAGHIMIQWNGHWICDTQNRIYIGV